MRTAAIATGVVCFLMVPSTWAQEVELQALFRRHREAYESIHSLQCVVDCDQVAINAIPAGLQPLQMASQTCRVEYWLQGSSVATRRSQPGEVRRTASHKGRTFTLNTQTDAGKIRAAGGVRDEEFVPTLEDALVLSHLKVWVPVSQDHRREIPVYEVCDQPFDSIAIVADSTEPVEVKRVDLSLRAGKRMSLWFDSRTNGLVKKVQHWTDGRIWAELTVLKFGEFAPGIYFPVEAEQRLSYNGTRELDLANRAHFQDISINQPIAESVFTIKFPSGLMVSDKSRNTAYPVDPDGLRIGPEKESVSPPGVALNKQSPASTHQTVVEPVPYGRNYWVVIVAIGGIAVGAVWLKLKFSR